MLRLTDFVRATFTVGFLLLCVSCTSEYDEICTNENTRKELIALKIAGRSDAQNVSTGQCTDELKEHLQKKQYKRFVFWVQKCVHGRSQANFSVEPCFSDLITFWGPDAENVRPEDHAMEVELKLAYFLKAKSPHEDGFIAYLNGGKIEQQKSSVNKPEKKQVSAPDHTPTYLPEPDFDTEEIKPPKRSSKKRKARKKRKRRRSKGKQR